MKNVGEGVGKTLDTVGEGIKGTGDIVGEGAEGIGQGINDAGKSSEGWRRRRYQVTEKPRRVELTSSSSKSYCAVQPPSIERVVPVTCPAASLHKYNTAAPISSGETKR